MPVRSIQNRRLYQQIAEQLRGMINRGEYPPGSYLPPERVLSRQFGVSRTSLREALIALEVLGLVRVRVGDGVSVVGPEQPAGVRTVPPLSGAGIPLAPRLQARRLVEPETAALAAAQASDTEIADIEATLRAGPAGPRDAAPAGQAACRFHVRVAEASGNPAYALLVRHLLGASCAAPQPDAQALRDQHGASPGFDREHAEVARAIRDRDADAARAAMARHLDSVIRAFSSGS